MRRRVKCGESDRSPDNWYWPSGEGRLPLADHLPDGDDPMDADALIDEDEVA
jgi:hypothetical protein